MKNSAKTLVIAGLMTGTASAAMADASILFATYAPPTNATNVHGFLPYLKKVDELSGGDISTSFSGGGAVVTAKTTLFALQDGLVDAVYLPSVYYPAELPVANLFVNLGSVLEDVPAAIAAMTEAYLFDCPECTAEDSKWNMHFLGSWSLTNYDLLCSKPVRTAEDVKGLRIRAAGHTVPLAAALGASPINVPSSEIFEIVQRGQVDCVFAPPAFLSTYSLGEITKYVVNVNAGTVPSPHNLVVREDLWNDLSAKDKRTLIEAAPIAAAGSYFGTLEGEEVELARPEIGYEVIEPDQSLKDAIKAATAGDVDRAIATAKDKGVENAEDIARKFMASYEKWRGLTAGINDRDAYADLLWRELYSRVAIAD